MVMNKASKIMIGLAGVFAAGAILGTLYAPDKGERTRRKIARKGRWLLHTANDTIEEGKDTLQEIRDRLKDNLEMINDEVSCLSRFQS